MVSNDIWYDYLTESYNEETKSSDIFLAWEIVFGVLFLVIGFNKLFINN